MSGELRRVQSDAVMGQRVEMGVDPSQVGVRALKKARAQSGALINPPVAPAAARLT